MYPVDDDKSMATEKIEPLPRMMSPVKKPPAEKPVKQRGKGGRTKGRITTPERKPVRKEPIPIQKDELKKKKGVVAWSDIVVLFISLHIMYFFSIMTFLITCYIFQQIKCLNHVRCHV